MRQKIAYEKLLTSRELEVLRMMIDGRTNPDIAAELVIEVGTVRWYTKQIYSKLGVHSRSQAILRAQKLSIFDDEAATADPLTDTATTPTIHNLPGYATSFIGRDGDVQTILHAIDNPDIRLITLAGAGGIGKTRLSIEVARHALGRFPDGVFFVPLAMAQSRRDVVAAIINEMNVRLTSQEQLLEYIRNKRILFLLDNFEHVLDAVDVVNTIIETSSDVHVMVTSRSALNLRKEWIRYLDGVSVPASTDVENPEDYGAVNLFMQRAHLVQGGFSLEENRTGVIRLSQLLHGLPLAIELAAAWLKTLSCDEIIAEIEHDLNFLSTKHADAEPRHRSLRVVFDQSWEMLSAKERRIASKLSVFRGGFGRRAAQQVTGASLQDLTNLIDKSIFQHNGTGLIFMHELMRQYAEQHLMVYFQGTVGTQTSLMAAWRSLLMGHFDEAADAAKMITDADEAKKPEEEAAAFALLSIMAASEEDYEQSFQLSQAALELIQRQPNDRGVVAVYFTHLGLAMSSCGVEDYNTATEAVITATQLASEIQIPSFALLCLPVASIILAHNVEVERAIQMMALAHSHPASAPAWIQRWAMLTNLQKALQAEVGAQAYSDLWARGQSANLDAVLNDFRGALHA